MKPVLLDVKSKYYFLCRTTLMSLQRSKRMLSTRIVFISFSPRNYVATVWGEITNDFYYRLRSRYFPSPIFKRCKFKFYAFYICSTPFTRQGVKRLFETCTVSRLKSTGANDVKNVSKRTRLRLKTHTYIRPCRKRKKNKTSTTVLFLAFIPREQGQLPASFHSTPSSFATTLSFASTLFQ